MSTDAGVVLSRARRIEAACRGVVEKVEGAIGCAAVDLENDALLGRHERSAGVAGLGAEELSAAVLLLRGTRLEQVARAAVGGTALPDGTEETTLEIHVTAGFTCHFAKVVPGREIALVLVAERDVNVGMAWAQLRAACQEAGFEESG